MVNAFYPMCVYEDTCNVNLCMGDTIVFEIVLCLGRGEQERGGEKEVLSLYIYIYIFFYFIKNTQSQYGRMSTFAGSVVICFLLYISAIIT